MAVLETITSPADLKRLPAEQLETLAEEIRAFLVAEVSRSGGHLGPNLGVVELTIALHRVFDSPDDTVVFDTGHQSYVHKLLTGRQDFSALRTRGGLSGYPSRAESEHDWVESSHASAALSYADGLAKSFALTGQDRTVVAIVGDGALTGGMCWEALNNIAADKTLPLVIVVNDNERSYAPTRGGMADYLASLRAMPGLDVVRPGDANEVSVCWGQILKNRSTAALALSRQGTPTVDRSEYAAAKGAAKGGYVLAESSTEVPDVIIVATGTEVAVALEDLLAVETVVEQTRLALVLELLHVGVVLVALDDLDAFAALSGACDDPALAAQ